MIAFEFASYKDALAAFREVQRRDKEFLKMRYDYLKAGFAAAKCLETDTATAFFAHQFLELGKQRVSWGSSIEELLQRRIIASTLSTIAPQMADIPSRSGEERVGVFYLSSTDALGHAILDPYHFLALHRQRFDRIYFIGPARESYRAGSQVCLEILEGYVQYIETGDNLLLNLSWMALGPITPPRIEFKKQIEGEDQGTGLTWSGESSTGTALVEMIIDNYWSCLLYTSPSPRD